jgi:TIR domain-containing protein
MVSGLPQSVFLSHAHADRSVALQVYHELLKAGIRCWLDEAEILPGESIMGKVEEAIDEMDLLAVVVSRTSVNSSWVRAELRMAMTDELKEARVGVIGLVVDDCRIPGFLRDKLYIDMRSSFMAGVERFVSALRGEARSVHKPRQAVVAELIESADDELWGRYSRRGLRQSDFANLLRSLSDDELTAAVAIAHRWEGFKAWDDGLIRIIESVIECDPTTARRIIRRLVDTGLLEPARDLDYSRRSSVAYTDGSALVPLRRFAVRSRAFDFLPPPPPELLSEVLAAVEPCGVASDGWYSLNFGEPVPRKDDSRLVKVGVQQYEPQRAWIFASAEDHAPELLYERRSSSDWTENSMADHGLMEGVGFALDRFDDLRLLR